jgi:hypothetical protein
MFIEKYSIIYCEGLQRIISEKLAMSVLEELEFVLRPSTSAKVFIEIEEEYLGNELDILDAIIMRRALVERATLRSLESRAA